MDENADVKARILISALLTLFTESDRPTRCEIAAKVADLQVKMLRALTDPTAAE